MNRIREQENYNRVMGVRVDEHTLAQAPVLEQDKQGRIFVVDVDAARRAALDLIKEITEGIPKELGRNTEMKALKKKIKTLESQIKREENVGKPVGLGTRSIDLEDDDDDE